MKTFEIHTIELIKSTGKYTIEAEDLESALRKVKNGLVNCTSNFEEFECDLIDTTVT